MSVTRQIVELEREIEALIKRAGDSLRQQADDRPRAGAVAVPDERAAPPRVESNTARPDRHRSS